MLLSTVTKQLLIFLASTTILIFGCGKEPVVEEPAPEYNRTVLLTNLTNNYIVPAYEAYAAQTKTLQDFATAFNSSPSTTTLQELRDEWEEALLVWQDVAFIEHGPSETLSLRSQTNIYPTDTVVILSNISSGTYDLQQIANFDAKGFQALDYLINGIGATDQDIVDYYTSNSNAQTYLQDVADELSTNGSSVSDSWSTYSTTFINNSASNAAGSAVSDIINALVQHYETYVRKGKIGLPAGVFNGFSQEALPTHVEALYFKESLPLIHRSLSAMQKFINGESYASSVNGEGLDDYMAFVEATSGSTPLEMVIDTQLDVIQADLLTLNDPFDAEVENNNEAVRTVYGEVQKLVGYLKIDMTNALDVLITYQDADGD